jgi:hypothetical protein
VKNATLQTIGYSGQANFRRRTKILKSESSAWNLTLRKTRRDAISDETKRIVYDFGYLQVFLILLETNLTLKEKD